MRGVKRSHNLGVGLFIAFAQLVSLVSATGIRTARQNKQHIIDLRSTLSCWFKFLKPDST